MKNFEECSTSEYYDMVIRENCNKYTKVELDKDTIQKIEDFVSKLIKQKKGEAHHKTDGNNEFERFKSGLMGEAAVEKLLGINFIDWTIGNSPNYNTPDIQEYSIGIKTSKQGRYPLVPRLNTYPQIICVRSSYYENTIWVCGLATPEVLNNYQSDTLVSGDVKKRKTGFYGFGELIPIKSLDDIKQYKGVR